jgi:hypothetical protein
MPVEWRAGSTVTPRRRLTRRLRRIISMAARPEGFAKVRW